MAAVFDDPPPLDDAAVAFISHAPLLFLMSGEPSAAPDVSPRGDAPGFVHVVDRRRLLVPDRVGNNRIDTIRNVMADPRLTVIFVCTGDERLLHVRGVAQIRTDPPLLARFEVNGRAPRSVMAIDVVSAQMSASSAFGRSGFWKPEKGSDGTFSFAAVIANLAGATVTEAERLVANDYKNELY